MDPAYYDKVDNMKNNTLASIASYKKQEKNEENEIRELDTNTDQAIKLLEKINQNIVEAKKEEEEAKIEEDGNRI